MNPNDTNPEAGELPAYTPSDGVSPTGDAATPAYTGNGGTANGVSGGGTPPQPWQSTPVKPKTSGLSVAALIVAIIALVLSIAGISMNLVPSGTPDSATTASQTSAETSREQDDGNTADAPTDAMGEGDSGDWHIKYTGWQTGTDYDGTPILMVSVEITNNGDANDYPMSVKVKAYQNGKGLGERGIFDGDNPLYEAYTQSLEDSMTELQPGTTITYNKFFELDDTTSPVTVEAIGGYGLAGEKVSETVTLSE